MSDKRSSSRGPAHKHAPDIGSEWTSFYRSLPSRRARDGFDKSNELLESEKRKDGSPYSDHTNGAAQLVSIVAANMPYMEEGMLDAFFHDTVDQVAKYDPTRFKGIRFYCGPHFEETLDHAVMMAAPQALDEITTDIEELKMLKGVATAVQVNSYGNYFRLPGMNIAHVAERTHNFGSPEFIYQLPTKEQWKVARHHAGKAVFSNRFVRNDPHTHHAFNLIHQKYMEMYDVDFGVTPSDVEHYVQRMYGVYSNYRHVLEEAILDHTPRFGLTLPRMPLELQANTSYELAANG